MELPMTSHESVNSKCCCFNMRKISRAVTQYFDRQLEPAGIRATQFTLLVELSHVSAKTLTEIATGLVMDRTTLTRNLRPLEKAGFISNFQPADKRAKAYLLTDKGKEVLARATPLWEQAQKHMTDHLGDERYDHILSELTRLLAAVPEEILRNSKK